MVLVDAGPLIALCNSADPDHVLCVKTLKSLAPPLLTTWTAFGEAMHLLGNASERQFGRPGKWKAQSALWNLIDAGALELAEPTVHTLKRMRELMERYRDTPMDLADASLVALAEDRNLLVIFTLDSDFEVYRMPGN
ncbi:MAG: PIN domain-containing protein, partial [Cyanobacteria bacterium NC_groundwater_1444_Ag_S-0.65um_54_12]|nr:PIN domain-containing protein [Cyanobacteria bacterium NC_groundwater_1444_Ag_S-0.65um_54_12]